MRIARVLMSAGLLGVACLRCASTEQLAPPLAALYSAPALEAMSMDTRAAIERGRALYITDCTDCHSPEAVLKYSAREWDEILPRMAKESLMNAQQQAEVRAYIDAVQRSAASATEPLGAHAPTIK